MPIKISPSHGRGLPKNISLDNKRRFNDLASALSPENLHQDGERSAAAARSLGARLKAEWRALERKVGRSVDEGEVYGWLDEIQAAAKADMRLAMEAQPSHPLLRQDVPNVWSRQGRNGMSAYYVQLREGTFKVFSEFSYILDGREFLDGVATLDAAVRIGESYLESVSEAAFQRKTQYTSENITRALARLPDDILLQREISTTSVPR